MSNWRLLVSRFEEGFNSELQKIAVFGPIMPAVHAGLSKVKGLGSSLGESIGNPIGEAIGGVAEDPWPLIGTVGGGLMGYHLGRQYTGSRLGGLAGMLGGGYLGHGAGGWLSEQLAGEEGPDLSPARLDEEWAHKIKPETGPEAQMFTGDAGLPGTRYMGALSGAGGKPKLTPTVPFATPPTPRGTVRTPMAQRVAPSRYMDTRPGPRVLPERIGY